MASLGVAAISPRYADGQGLIGPTCSYVGLSSEEAALCGFILRAQHLVPGSDTAEQIRTWTLEPPYNLSPLLASWVTLAWLSPLSAPWPWHITFPTGTRKWGTNNTPIIGLPNNNVTGKIWNSFWHGDSCISRYCFYYYLVHVG